MSKTAFVNQVTSQYLEETVLFVLFALLLACLFVCLFVVFVFFFGSLFRLIMFVSVCICLFAGVLVSVFLFT